MSALLWGAVAFCTFVILATAIGTVVLAIRGWRLFNDVRSGLLRALEELGESVTQLEGRIAALDARGADLQRASARLSRSLAEMRILIGAAREVGDLVGRVRGIVPTK